MPKSTTSSYLRNKKGVTESLDTALGKKKAEPAPAPAPKAKPVPVVKPKPTIGERVKNVASALRVKDKPKAPKNPTRTTHKVPRVGRRTSDDY